LKQVSADPFLDAERRKELQAALADITGPAEVSAAEPTRMLSWERPTLPTALIVGWGICLVLIVVQAINGQGIGFEASYSPGTTTPAPAAAGERRNR